MELGIASSNTFEYENGIAQLGSQPESGWVWPAGFACTPWRRRPEWSPGVGPRGEMGTRWRRFSNRKGGKEKMARGPTVNPARPPRARRVGWLTGLLVGMTLLAFGRTLGNDFILYADDDQYVTQNPAVHAGP